MSQFLTPNTNPTHMLDSDFVQDIDSGDEINLDEDEPEEENQKAKNELFTKISQGHPHLPSDSTNTDENRKNLPPLVVENYFSPDALLNGIFEVEGKSFDVSLHRTHIQLKSIGGSRKTSHRKSVTKVLMNENDTVNLLMKDIFAVTASKAKANGKKTENGQGVELHSYTEKEGNRIKYKIIFLAHPSEKLCDSWVEQINVLLKGVLNRPKACRVYRSLKGCTKSAKQQLEETVLPMFSLANISVKHMGVMNDESIVKDIMSSDLSSIDCVIIAGGDEAVHIVMNSIIKKIQFDNGVVLGGKENLMRVTIPIGVLPCGVFNTIAHTVHGTSDMVTAALHIIYGRVLTTDIFSITSNDSDMFEFALYAHYGYGGSFLSLIENKSITNHKQVAIMKSLTKNKLRAYECEVKYVPAPTTCGSPSEGMPCRSGCTVCKLDTATPHIAGSHYSDSLHEFDPLEASNSSANFRDLSLVCNEQTAKGEFMSVSLLAVACLDDMAPLGFSKLTHLADGCMDLVMVNNVKRKEFMKFLQRVGNTKNQLEYPYVQSYRVREATFHARLPMGWNFRDENYSEIEDQAKHHVTVQSSAAGSEIRTINDGTSTMISTLSMDDSDDDSDLSDGYDMPSRMSSNRSSVKGHGSQGSNDDVTLHHSQEFGKLAITPAEDPRHAGHVHPIHKYTMADRLRKKRADKELAKEKKQKEKHEKSIKSVWNIDSLVFPNTDLTFKIHQKLLTFYGSTLDPDHETSDVFCFPAI